MFGVFPDGGLIVTFNRRLATLLKDDEGFYPGGVDPDRLDVTLNIAGPFL